jgi:hypothetical protein
MFARQGHIYIGGASVPWFVTDSMLKSGARGYGFDQVEVHSPEPVPVLMPAQTPAPVTQAGPGWDWPVPPELVPKTLPVDPPATGPALVGDTSALHMPLLVGMGVIGGAFFGYQAYSHMFKEGLTSHERGNILKAAGAMLALFGVAMLLDVDKAWWLTPQGLAAKAEEEARTGLK